MLTHAFGGWPTWSDPGESLSKRRNIYAADTVSGTAPGLVPYGTAIGTTRGTVR